MAYSSTRPSGTNSSFPRTTVHDTGPYCVELALGRASVTQPLLIPTTFGEKQSDTGAEWQSFRQDSSSSWVAEYVFLTKSVNPNYFNCPSLTYLPGVTSCQPVVLNAGCPSNLFFQCMCLAGGLPHPQKLILGPGQSLALSWLFCP